jgi:hypothetical protein
MSPRTAASSLALASVIGAAACAGEPSEAGSGSIDGTTTGDDESGSSGEVSLAMVN